MSIDHLNLILPLENGYELCRGSLQYGYVLQLKVSFKMGLFSDTKHTHPGIFILESPPPPPPGWMHCTFCTRALHKVEPEGEGDAGGSQDTTMPGCVWRKLSKTGLVGA